MLHKRRQIAEVAPELIDLFGRTPDDNSLGYANAVVPRCSSISRSATQPLSAKHVEGRNAEHRCSCCHDPGPVCTALAESRTERCQIYNITRYPAPQPS